MKNKHQNLFRKALSLLLVAVVGLMPVMPTYAAEVPYEVGTTTNSNNDVELIEDIDPNIIVTITELDEPPIMSRSFYSSTFDYSREFLGTHRDYDGNNLGAEISTQSTSGGNFELQLVRWGSSRVIAKAQLPKNGNFHVDFTNVGAGKYAFGFKQVSIIGTRQWGTINMFSWWKLLILGSKVVN